MTPRRSGRVTTTLWKKQNADLALELTQHADGKKVFACGHADVGMCALCGIRTILRLRTAFAPPSKRSAPITPTTTSEKSAGRHWMGRHEANHLLGWSPRRNRGIGTDGRVDMGPRNAGLPGDRRFAFDYTAVVVFRWSATSRRDTQETPKAPETGEEG